MKFKCSLKQTRHLVHDALILAYGLQVKHEDFAAGQIAQDLRLGLGRTTNELLIEDDLNHGRYEDAIEKIRGTLVEIDAKL